MVNVSQPSRPEALVLTCIMTLLIKLTVVGLGAFKQVRGVGISGGKPAGGGY